MTHTLQHAVGEACRCDMKDIHQCVICGRLLTLLREQRRML